MTNRTLVRVRAGVRVRAWIKIYIRVLRTWNYYPILAQTSAYSVNHVIGIDVYTVCAMVNLFENDCVHIHIDCSIYFICNR